jgi:ribose transport system ATP-binding protein
MESSISIANLSKTFGATHALVDVSFSVRPGSVHALLGENGSGKSTLIKILAGVHAGEPGGTITVGGATIDASDVSVEFARTNGLRFVHQNPAVFAEMTVLENMAIGNGFKRRAAGIDWRYHRERTERLLTRYHIDARPDQLVGSLRPAEQSMLAVARALQDLGEGAVSVIVFDEPTASLPPSEVDVLLKAIRGLSDSGHTVLYVTHRMDEILNIGDSVTVLRDGRHVTTRTTEGLTEAMLVEYIVGRPLEQVFGSQQAPVGSDVRLRVQELRGGPLESISFSLREGEIVGLAGLLGSGRTELLRMIFGAHPIAGGKIWLEGEEFVAHNPSSAMDQGIAYVPEDREHDAAFLELSVRDNLSVASIPESWSKMRRLHRKERDKAQAAISMFAIKTAGDGALISSLSGGNQQKVILARWLQRKPRVLLLDEPTQGVDVGARADVYAAIRQAVSVGMSALLVCSDLEELSQSCDRALVLRQGRVVAELSGDELTAQRLTRLVHLAEDEAS